MGTPTVASVQKLKTFENGSGLLDRVGRTPLLPLSRSAGELPHAVEVFAKVEWQNPGGSVKDRPAASILRRAIELGELAGDRILLDSTSGNMGIAYATLGAALGIPVHLVIPSNAGRQRLAILRALGAQLTLSDPLEGSDGAREVASEMASKDPERFYYADQYSNPANWMAHYATTGPEIFEQTGGRVTHFVAGLGTTGTLMGVGRFLKSKSEDIRIVAVQPDSPLHGLEGLKHLESSPIPGIFDPHVVDKTLAVSTEDSYVMARRLAREEGLIAGTSAAAAAVAALRVAASLESGVVVALFPDSGLKYLDEPQWGAA